MTFFEWSEDLSVGNALLDGEHRMLVGLVNELYACRRQDGGAAVAAAILQRLVAYTEEHFAREELHMARIAYPHLDGHRAEHVALLASLRELSASHGSGEAAQLSRLALLLRDWLSVHIMCWDKDIARRGGPVADDAVH